jgi:hypothetical protein
VALGDGATASLIPTAGTRSVVISSGSHAGKITLNWGGVKIAPTVVSLAPGTTRAIAVPKGATVVIASSNSSGYVAAVRVQSTDGAAILPLRPLLTDLLVPSVRPAWPPQ